MSGPSKVQAAARPGRTLTIGITGPIGCGKSTILGILAAEGALVIDADQVVRELTSPGSPVVAAIVAAFGTRVAGPDAGLDRAALAAIVFRDPAELQRLEAITHPVVRERILAMIRDAHARGVPTVALEAIRLVEAGYPALVDETWLVTCDPAAQRERLIARGLAAADAAARIAAQSTLAEHVRPVATRIIDTSGSIAETEAAVRAALAAARLPGDPKS
ncbi:MAG: dephospho-CoA kinase [Candidatus Limnocylindrales bacterium]